MYKQVLEEAKYKGKTTYTNFKRVVWHEAFRKLLKTLAPTSQLGWTFRSPDGTLYRLFPFVHILSADYEEQYVHYPILTLLIVTDATHRCVMTLIRGIGGYQPCPVCHVYSTELTQIYISHTRRVALTAQKTVWDKTLNKG